MLLLIGLAHFLQPGCFCLGSYTQTDVIASYKQGNLIYTHKVCGVYKSVKIHYREEQVTLVFPLYFPK